MFFEEIKKVFPITFLISCDVFSLFNIIPLRETIDIAVSLWFEHNTSLKITKGELKKHFDFATSGTHLIFKEHFMIK